jgi:pyridoxal 5'-phosphate synthase pdxT subunit
MVTTAPTVGILALQGCVRAHVPHLEACGARVRELRAEEDFDGCDALILPGGESTTMLRLLELFGLGARLARELEEKPAWGICAGAILLARELVGTRQASLGLIDCTVERNAYGRQLQSTQERVHGYPVSYIRAPILRAVGPEVVVLAKRGPDPVWILDGNRMATTFHPELTLSPPSPMHRALVELALEAARGQTARTIEGAPSERQSASRGSRSGAGQTNLRLLATR